MRWLEAAEEGVCPSNNKQTKAITEPTSASRREKGEEEKQQRNNEFGQRISRVAIQFERGHVRLCGQRYRVSSGP